MINKLPTGLSNLHFIGEEVLLKFSIFHVIGTKIAEICRTAPRITKPFRYSLHISMCFQQRIYFVRIKISSCITIIPLHNVILKVM